MSSTRRDLVYRMTADPEGFKKGMREAGQDSNQFYKELRQLEKQQKAVDQLMTAGGVALLGFGAAVGAGLGMAAKAAVNWESAWTGVAKVIEGSPEQLAALEEELRGLARTLPQTHEEIAGVAAAAGQLGVATEDITDFTRVMIDLGVATNLSSEDAAFALARMMNIMQTAPQDVSRLGSAIVDLGNNSATTEREITEMAMRIAGVGNTIGLSEANVLSYAAALSSVGVEAEAGGTAISQSFKIIDGAVRSGGESLETIARVAGTTADQFAAAFREKPAEAIEKFVRGLGRMNANGEDVNKTLNDLGMGGIRLSDSLLRLSGAGDLLADSIRIGNEAWDENTALMEEAGRRYGTTEAQMQIARNQIVDLGISIGQTLLPMIQRMLDVGEGLMLFFEDLPGPVKQGIVILGLITTAVALLGGAALVAVPKIHALNQALIATGSSKAMGVQRAISGLTGILAGPWGLVIGGAVTALGIFAAKQAESRARVEELSGTLDDQTSAVTGNTRAWIANELEQAGVLTTAQDLGIDLATLVDAITGEQEALDAVNAVLDEHRGELKLTGQTVGGTASEVQVLTGEEGKLDSMIRQLTGDLDDATDAHQRKADAVDGGTESTKEASAETQILAERLGMTEAAALDAADAFSDLDSKIKALIDSAFALNEAERQVEAGIDNLTDALEENGATVDRSTEKGRANEKMIEDQVAAIAELALTTAEQTGSASEANKVLEEQTARLEEVMRQAGFTESEIEDYISVLDRIPDEIRTAIEANVNVNTTETVRRLIQEHGQVAKYENFEGGVYYPAQHGLINAGIFPPAYPARYAFAEPQTGGEAFVPRIGDRSRSLAILSEAAAWHRASVVPHESGSQVVNVHLKAYSDTFRLRQVLDDLAMGSAS